MNESQPTLPVEVEANPTRPRKKKSADMALIPAPGQPAPSTALEVFERLARDPKVNADKLERLIGIQKEIMRVESMASFERAFAAMQGDITNMKKTKPVKNRDGSVRWKYVPFDVMVEKLRPILIKHEFTLRHRTEWPEDGQVRTIGRLSHVQGHFEESIFQGPPDKSDHRTAIQDRSSTQSYGKRYTTKDLLLIAEEGEDTDGPQPEARQGRTGRPDPQAGMALFISDAARATLWRTARKANRTETEIMMWLKVAKNVEDTAHIKVEDYDGLIAAIEKPGALPLPEQPAL